MFTGSFEHFELLFLNPFFSETCFYNVMAMEVIGCRNRVEVLMCFCTVKLQLSPDYFDALMPLLYLVFCRLPNTSRDFQSRKLKHLMT